MALSEVLVHVAARDLFFRAKVEGTVRLAGAKVASEEECHAAILEAGSATVDRVRQLRARGVMVLVFGPHVDVDRLREARDAGATAVPNSQVEAAAEELVRYLFSSPSEGSDGS